MRTSRIARILLSLWMLGAGGLMAEDLFTYDPRAALDVKVLESSAQDGVEQREITFTGDPASKGVVKATLVAPSAQGKTAGILWVHWLGEPATTNRTEFRDEAIAMASKGVTSLLVDTMWSKPKWYSSRTPEEDHAHAIQQVIELRRALDLLLRQPSVDASRIAIVGHDYGGMFTSLMLGADHRVQSCVLIAVTPDLMDWAFYGPRPKSETDYRAQHQDLDIPKAIARAKGTHFLLQFAQKDDYVPEAKAWAYITATPEPKTWKIYEDAGHEMTKPRTIREDRQAWLAQALSLTGR
jgi:dienelactone hydrolase